MSKELVVAEQKSAILAGQDAALQAGLELVYDKALAEAPVGGGGFTQEQMDAAVALAVAPLNEANALLQGQVDFHVAKDVEDEKQIAAGKLALEDLRVAFEALSAKEQVEAGIIDGLKGSLAILQDVVAKLSGVVG